MTQDLITWLKARLDEDEAIALAVEPLRARSTMGGEIVDRLSVVRFVAASEDAMPTREADPAAQSHTERWSPARVLAEVAAKRRILDEHAAELRNVEWPHDQTGDGKAWCCRRCQNAENDSADWHPAFGEAGTFPHEPFITPYVLAPCRTILALAQPYSSHPDWQAEWTVTE